MRVSTTGLSQAGNPLNNLFGGYSGNKVSANKPVNFYVASGGGLSLGTLGNVLGNSIYSAAASVVAPGRRAALTAGVSFASATTSLLPPIGASRTNYLQSRIDTETRQGNFVEAGYVRQQLALESASRTGAYPDQSLYQSFSVQVDRNSGAVQGALEFPQRKFLGTIGTSPEELAAAAAYAGGDAYVPANHLVEIAPGIYRQPQVYAPEQNPNYSKYRVGTGILSDPLTYLPAGVAAAVNRGRAASQGFAAGTKYSIGEYRQLVDVAEAGLDAHHVGQKALMKKLIPNYDPATAPSILVPRAGHPVGGETGVVSRSMKGFDNARTVIAEIFGNCGACTLIFPTRNFKRSFR